MKFLTPILIGAAIAAAPVTGAQALNCKNPDTQLAKNTCAARDFAREDARLNRAYRELASKLEPGRRDPLKTTELAWISFRDLQCDFQADAYQGGSIAPLVRSSCLARMTRERTKELKALTEEASQ